MDVYQWAYKNVLLHLTEGWYHLTAHWYLSGARPGSTLSHSCIINQTLSYRDTIRQFIVHAVCYHGSAPSHNAKQHPPRLQMWQIQAHRAREGQGRSRRPVLANTASLLMTGWWMGWRCWRSTDGAAAAAVQPFADERSKRFDGAHFTRGFASHPGDYLQKLSVSSSNCCALCVYVSLRSHQPQLRRQGLVSDGQPRWPVPGAAASRRPAARPRHTGLLGDWQQRRGGHRGNHCVPVNSEKFLWTPRSCGSSQHFIL